MKSAASDEVAMLGRNAAVVIALVALFAASAPVAAQPTYKLDVKPEFRPRARLTIDATNRIARTAVANDPGFRLQYHFQRDGKTLATAEARLARSIESPKVEAGIYSVVLEVFYPAYKGGTDQKGGFRSISNVLTYRVEPGSPPKLTRLAVPPPAAVTTTAGAGALLVW